MRLMYSLVKATEVSWPDAISAWSWATVASLCCVGTSCVASFAAARGSVSKAATRRERTAGTIIVFLLWGLNRGVMCGNSATLDCHCQGIPTNSLRARRTASTQILLCLLEETTHSFV